MHSSHRHVLGHRSSDIAQKTQDTLQDVKRLVKAREKKKKRGLSYQNSCIGQPPLRCGGYNHSLFHMLGIKIRKQSKPFDENSNTDYLNHTNMIKECVFVGILSDIDYINSTLFLICTCLNNDTNPHMGD